MNKQEYKTYSIFSLMVAGILVSLFAQNSLVSEISILFSIGLGIIVFRKVNLVSK